MKNLSTKLFLVCLLGACSNGGENYSPKCYGCGCTQKKGCKVKKHESTANIDNTTKISSIEDKAASRQNMKAIKAINK